MTNHLQLDSVRFSEEQKYITIKTLTFVMYKYIEKLLETLPDSFSYDDITKESIKVPEIVYLDRFIALIHNDMYCLSILEVILENTGTGDGENVTKKEIIKIIEETKEDWNNIPPEQFGFDLEKDPLK